MVQVIVSKLADHKGYGQGQPLIHVHHVARDVHGNGIAIRVYGEMKIAAGECVFAKELKLNTIQVLVLTPEVPRNTLGYMAQKYVFNKGEYDNRASIDIYDDASVWQGADVPGSLWLNFIALGE